MTRAEEVWFEIAKLLDTEKDEKRFVAIIAAALAESRAHGVREARALVVSELRSLPGFWTLPWDLEKLIEKHFDLLSSAPEQPNAVERQAMAGVYGFAPEVPDKLAGLRERIRSALAQLQDIHWPEGKECSKDCRVCRAEEELIAALEATR